MWMFLFCSVYMKSLFDKMEIIIQIVEVRYHWKIFDDQIVQIYMKIVADDDYTFCHVKGVLIDVGWLA